MGCAVAPEIRFFRHVDKQLDGCWMWTGMTAGTKSIYGYFRATTKATDSKMLAHRWSYEFHVGPIPEGLELDHVVCRRPLCVNPWHLEPVTPDENSRRTRLAFCRARLHDLSLPENVRWDGQGRRRGCLRCWLDRAKERYHRNKGGQ